MNRTEEYTDRNEGGIPIHRKIWDLLRENPGLVCGDVGRIMSLDMNTAYNYLRRMESKGIVRREVERRPICYHHKNGDKNAIIPQQVWFANEGYEWVGYFDSAGRWRAGCTPPQEELAVRRREQSRAQRRKNAPLKQKLREEEMERKKELVIDVLSNTTRPLLTATISREAGVDARAALTCLVKEGKVRVELRRGVASPYYALAYYVEESR